MTPSPQSSPQPISAPAAANFFAGAIPRMLRLTVVIGLLLVVFLTWRLGLRTGIGFLAGAFISYLNFRSLDRAVNALATRIVEAHQPERGYSLVGRFVLRYLLAGIVAYVIFTSSFQAFRGFLFGLCTPVAAMLFEAGYEAYAALRRGY